MIPKYKLLYFNVTGLAEPIRYLLHYKNIPFEDHRFEYDEWLKIKPNMPFGQVPVLIEDGKEICQSVAICRYLGKKFGLTGKDDKEALEADIIVDTLTDLRLNYKAYFLENNEEVKAKLLEDIKVTHNPFYLPKFEEIVRINGGYFVNNQLTWADLYFASITDLLVNIINEPILKPYPQLTSLKEKIDSHPNIKIYRNNRPKTLI